MAIGESTLGPTVTGVLSLDDVSLEGKTVLLRVDVNSPINPENMEFMDDRRFTEFLPTLDDLSSSKVVVISHINLGRENLTLHLQNHIQNYYQS